MKGMEMNNEGCREWQGMRRDEMKHKGREGVGRDGVLWDRKRWG